MREGRAARDVPVGQIWAFRDHRAMYDIMQEEAELEDRDFLLDSDAELGYVPLARTAEDMQVEVKAVGSDKWHATVQDSKRQRAWSGEGVSPSDASTKALRGFLGDRRSAEYVGEKK